MQMPKVHGVICLIRLEEIRPKRFPRLIGLSSENAAHRVAVVWEDANGPHEGVYIPRRDTGSLLTHLAGGRIFPGEHQRAAFRVQDTGDTIELKMNSADGLIQVEVAGAMAAELPATSIFRTVNDASAFFEPGVIGYSTTASGRHLDGVVLKTHSWSVAPLSIERVSSKSVAGERATHVFLRKRT